MKLTDAQREQFNAAVAEWVDGPLGATEDDLARAMFAAGIAQGRARCAKVCRELYASGSYHPMLVRGANRCATAIESPTEGASDAVV